jgi:hypothetical protein
MELLLLLFWTAQALNTPGGNYLVEIEHLRIS